MAAQRRHIESEEGSEEGYSGPRWQPYFECCPGMDPTFDSDYDWEEEEEWDESGNLVKDLVNHRSARKEEPEQEPEYKSSGGGPPARSAEAAVQDTARPQRRSRRRRGWKKLACLNCGCTQWTRRRWPWREKNLCGWCRYWWDSGYFWNLDCTKTRWYQCRETYWWHFEPRSGDETKWHSWHRGVEWYFSAAECRDWWRAQTRSFVLAGVEQWGGPSEIPRLRR